MAIRRPLGSPRSPHLPQHTLATGLLEGDPADVSVDMSPSRSFDSPSTRRRYMTSLSLSQDKHDRVERRAGMSLVFG